MLFIYCSIKCLCVIYSKRIRVIDVDQCVILFHSMSDRLTGWLDSLICLFICRFQFVVIPGILLLIHTDTHFTFIYFYSYDYAFQIAYHDSYSIS